MIVLNQFDLSPVQLAILTTVRRFPGQFSRSGLAKLLVGSRSWQDIDHPAYSRLAGHGRKDVTYQIDILLQQGFLGLDRLDYLVIPPEKQEGIDQIDK